MDDHHHHWGNRKVNAFSKRAKNREIPFISPSSSHNIIWTEEFPKRTNNQKCTPSVVNEFKKFPICWISTPPWISFSVFFSFPCGISCQRAALPASRFVLTYQIRLPLSSLNYPYIKIPDWLLSSMRRVVVVVIAASYDLFTVCLLGHPLTAAAVVNRCHYNQTRHVFAHESDTHRI